MPHLPLHVLIRMRTFAHQTNYMIVIFNNQLQLKIAYKYKIMYLLLRFYIFIKGSVPRLVMPVVTM